MKQKHEKKVQVLKERASAEKAKQLKLKNREAKKTVSMRPHLHPYYCRAEIIYPIIIILIRAWFSYIIINSFDHQEVV